MICKNCNFNNDDNALFCSRCGQKLNYEYYKNNFKDEKVSNSIFVKINSKNQKNNYNLKQKHHNYNSNKKYIKLIIALVITIFIAFIVNKVFYDKRYDSSFDTKQNKIVQNSNKKEETYNSDKENKFNEFQNNTSDKTYEKDEDFMSFVNSSSEPNYLEYNYPDDFEIYHADGYSFGYPKNFYNYSEETEHGYEFISDNGSSFKISVSPRDNIYTDMDDDFNNMYNDSLDRIYDPETILYKENKDLGCKRFIVNGFTDKDITAAVYYLCNVYEDKIEVYELITTLKGYSLEERYHANYILDTVYRLCSFGGTSYKPRTYKQMMDNELGDKK